MWVTHRHVASFERVRVRLQWEDVRPDLNAVERHIHDSDKYSSLLKNVDTH
jgi:hypothetical protein